MVITTLNHESNKRWVNSQSASPLSSQSMKAIDVVCAVVCHSVINTHHVYTFTHVQGRRFADDSQQLSLTGVFMPWLHDVQL